MNKTTRYGFPANSWEGMIEEHMRRSSVDFPEQEIESFLKTLVAAREDPSVLSYIEAAINFYHLLREKAEVAPPNAR